MNRAFTIIELLIVIAIIGILAALILSELNNARDQGIEAKVKSELSSLQKRAAIEESQNYSYDATCGSNGVATSAVVMDIIASINRFASSTVVCNSSRDGFAASAPITGSTHWCVDSNGNAFSTSSALAPGVLRCK